MIFSILHMIILYGSQTGNSIHISDLIQNTLLYGYNTDTIYNISKCSHNKQFYIEMDAFDFEKILEIKTMIFVCSTHGNGTEPFNMSKFWRILKNKNLPPGILSHLRFGIFGLGDSSYKSYNYCSKKLYNCLIKLGAQPLIRRGCGDSQDKEGFMTDFKNWIKELYPIIKNEVLVDANVYKKSVSLGYQARVLDIITLTPIDYENPVIELCFDIPDFKEYSVGDCLTVYPENYNTHEFMSFNNLDRSVFIDINSNYDYNSIPQPFFFLKLYLYTVNRAYVTEEIRNKIKEIYDNYDLYYDYVLLPRRTVFEVLKDFKINVSYDFIKQSVPLINPRYFTLTLKEKKYFITVSLVSYRTRLIERRKGLCSEYLRSLEKSSVLTVNIVSNNLNITNKKLLFICTGSGITLPRSVVNNYKDKEIFVYYGFRYKSSDMLYADEFKKENINFVPVSSREDGKYVQDIFKETFKLNIDEWSVFISGNSRLNNIVENMFNEMYKKKINFQTETW
jgi:sulfite reductase alpha subunit-like flavoprotein